MRILAGLAIVIATPVMAADCPLERAVYDQDESGYEIRFHPVPREDELGVSNSFELVAPGDATHLVGRVSWGNGFSRPTGRLLFGCPSDPSYEDEQACTHWTGVIYAIAGSKVDLLGEPESPAPEQLLFSNLGQSLNYSMFPTLLGEPIGEMPWDVFTFKACAT